MYSVSNVFLSCLKNGKDSVSSYLCTLIYLNLAAYELNSLHSTIFWVNDFYLNYVVFYADLAIPTKKSLF